MLAQPMSLPHDHGDVGSLGCAWANPEEAASSASPSTAIRLERRGRAFMGHLCLRRSVFAAILDSKFRVRHPSEHLSPRTWPLVRNGAALHRESRAQGPRDLPHFVEPRFAVRAIAPPAMIVPGAEGFLSAFDGCPTRMRCRRQWCQSRGEQAGRGRSRAWLSYAGPPARSLLLTRLRMTST
jgi:hypothetical protein